MTPPGPSAGQAQARAQMMTGAMLVMGACVFGGLTAIVLVALGQRLGAGAVAILAGLAIIVGIFVQVLAMKKLKAASHNSASHKAASQDAKT